MIQIVELSCTLIKTAVLTTNVDKEHQWPQYSPPKQAALLETISVWLPHCVRLVQSMYASLVKMEISNEAIDLTAKLLLDLKWVKLWLEFKFIEIIFYSMITPFLEFIRW